jgi:hypothetical protein
MLIAGGDKVASPIISSRNFHNGRKSLWKFRFFRCGNFVVEVPLWKVLEPYDSPMGESPTITHWVIYSDRNPGQYEFMIELDIIEILHFHKNFNLIFLQHFWCPRVSPTFSLTDQVFSPTCISPTFFHRFFFHWLAFHRPSFHRPLFLSTSNLTDHHGS